MFDALFSSLQNAMSAFGGVNFCSMDLNAMNSAFNSGLNAQMQAVSNHIVQQNMNNPDCQQLYQAHRQQGGTLDFPAFCLQYAETGGFTPEGKQRYMQSRTQIQTQDQANMNAHRQYSENLQRETTAYRNAVQDKWANQRGETLSAEATFVNSANGTAWQLPTNLSLGQTVRDPGSGNDFAMDIHGQYWMTDGHGNWQSMNYRG